MITLALALTVHLDAQPPQRPQAPPRDSSATTATGTAVIRGRVFAADSKKPLRRARIIVSSPGLGQGSAPDEQEHRRPLRSQRTARRPLHDRGPARGLSAAAVRSAAPA